MIYNKDIPEPDILDEPETEIDELCEAEVDRLLIWFITKNKRIAWHFGCDELVIAPKTNQNNKEEFTMEIFTL